MEVIEKISTQGWEDCLIKQHCLSKTAQDYFRSSERPAPGSSGRKPGEPAEGPGLRASATGISMLLLRFLWYPRAGDWGGGGSGWSNLLEV